jgi:polar amino acid transport system substrate-binding protein
MFIKKILLIFIIATQLFCSDTNSSKTNNKEIFVVSEAWENLTNKDGSGLYFELTKMIYGMDGFHVKVKTYPFSRASMMVKNKLADAYLGSYVDSEDYAIYPKYYFDHDVVFAMYKREKFPNFHGLESLKGHNICWIRGYAYDDYIDFPITKHVRNNRKAILNSLAADRFDIYIDAKYDMETAIKQLNFDTSDYEFQQILEFKLYPAFRNDKRGQILKKIWDKNFQKLLESGELKKLYQRHHLEEYYLY